MEYCTYAYHCCKHVTRPRQTTANIKGLELEISDDTTGEFLDNLIEENILTVPSNETDKKEYTICVEEDGSVYKELIFKASCNNTLFKGVRKLEEKLHEVVDNSHGTSCHIHLNRAHLRERNISDNDIVKATEFIAPILYEISGRSFSSYEQWAKSGIEYCQDIRNPDLFKRAEYIDEELETYNGRYAIVNCNPSASVEIRIFSNFYNFNYKYIKMYIETTDFIMELAEKMKNKKYKEEYNKIIKDIKSFFKQRKYNEIYKEHTLEIFFASAKERQLIELSKELTYINKKINQLKEIISDTTYDFYIKRTNAIALLRVLRDYSAKYSLDELTINIYDFDIEKIEEKIIESIENRISEVEAQEE